MSPSFQEKLFPSLLAGWRWVEKNSAILVLLLALITFVSAFAGVTVPNTTLSATAGAVDTPTSTNADEAGSILSLFNWFSGKVYESTRAILLDMESHGDDFNVFIGIARLAAVVLVTVVATQAISRLFQDSLSGLRLWFRGKRNVFVGGLGRIGFQLATDYAKQGKLVVVEELDEPNYWTKAAEFAGAIVLKGDVTYVDSLREHIFRDPETIHLVTGNDLANINALANVQALRLEHLTQKGKLLGACKCFVHIEDSGLHRSLKRCLIESACQTDHSLRIHIFNIYHETACQLIFDKLTPLRPRERDEVALYIVFGFAQMGTAMIKELAEYAHFENQKRSRILVLTPNAKDECDRCMSQWERLSPHFVHPDLSSVRFNPECDEWTSQAARPKIGGVEGADPKEVEYAANVHFCEYTDTDSFSLSDVRYLVKLASEEDVCPVALFCFEDDETNFKLATEFNDALQDIHGINRKLDIPADKRGEYSRHDEFHLPIFTFLPRSRPLRDILAESKDKFPLQAFGAVQEGLERAHDDTLEQVAIDIACAYDAESKRRTAREKEEAKYPDWEKDGRVLKIPSDQELGIVTRVDYPKIWQAKSYWEQHSNLTAAEHAWVKVQLLGHRFVRGKPSRGPGHDDVLGFDSTTHEERAMLAIAEHNRWMAERLLLGWCYGSRSEQPPMRASLCPWQDLPQKEPEKDFNQIITVLRYFNARGYCTEPSSK